MRRTTWAVLLLLGFALPAAAAQLTGNQVIIPVVGRAPGLYGTFWKTDVYVTNFSRRNLPVRFEFMSGGAVQAFELSFGPLEVYVVHDYVFTKHLQDTGVGLLRITSRDPEARIAARAWVYNSGPDGRAVGQNVQGVASSALVRDSYLTGLEVTDANRTNIGFANPYDVDAELTLVLSKANGSDFATVRVPARGTLQLNLAGVFPYRWPDHGLTLEVRSRVPVVPYASVVNNRSGDPQFVPPVEFPIAYDEPACLDALTLWNPSIEGHWTVWLRDPADGARLASKYGFTIDRSEKDAIAVHNLTAQQLAAMRCDPAIAELSSGWPYSGPVP